MNHWIVYQELAQQTPLTYDLEVAWSLELTDFF